MKNFPSWCRDISDAGTEENVLQGRKSGLLTYLRKAINIEKNALVSIAGRYGDLFIRMVVRNRIIWLRGACRTTNFSVNILIEK